MLQPDIDSAPVNFALYMAYHGNRVIWLPPREKGAKLKDWPQLATNEESTITKWFDRYPERNYGIVADQRLIVDVDPKNGGQFWLDDNRYRLPETWEFISGSGGVHLIYAAPPGLRKFDPAPGVNVLTGNAYIVGPGSIHPNGQPYKIRIGPDDQDIANAPDWLIGLATTPDKITASSDPTGVVSVGNRQTALAALAGHYAHMRSFDVAVQALRDAVKARFEQKIGDPITDEQIVGCMKRVWANEHSNQTPAPDFGILTRQQFVESMKPPAYLDRDLRMQRGYFYSMTGLTGSGKTAILLLQAHALEKRVLYLAGENPDDVAHRTSVMPEHTGFKGNLIDYFRDPFDLESGYAMIEARAQAVAGYDLIIVDTHTAFLVASGSDDENANVQALAMCKRYRRLTTISGNPTVIVACHPTKNAGHDSLLPRGAGAFINEADGNYTLWSDDNGQTTELHWQGKFRGPTFQPITFKLIPVDGIKDADGEPVTTVYAQPMSERDAEAHQTHQREDHERLLLSMAVSDTSSIADLARGCGWFNADGPDRSKVQRNLKKLKAGRMIEDDGLGHRLLTSKGRKLVKSIKSKDDAF